MFKQPMPQSSRIANLLLFLLIIIYCLFFSWYTINRHNSLNSYAADLSLIDQPMWNTVRGPGGFMELTWGDRQQPRLAEHFEPVLIILALLFFLWDDVRILLIAQTIALAIGALPVFWIAKRQFSKLSASAADWIALTFSAVYLLSPHLQSANIADFHADPFAVAPLLFAFWYATQERWGWMWFWAILVMSSKETLPTLTAMLGLYLLFDFLSGTVNREKLKNGLALIMVSSVWFLISTFLIVSPLAQQYFGTAGPIYFENRYQGDGLLSLIQDTDRWWYLVGLLASVGFLPLLAPELLILGLPVLAANILSNFPGQYSGEQHYSAPLVAAFIISAIYGASRLINRLPLHERGRRLTQATIISISLWLLISSISYHALHGWTPLSTRYETYKMSPAAENLADFTAQIPPDAVVSASAGIHPHLAHRQIIYIFPTVQEADYLLVDITDIPGVHPNDARTKLLDMLNNGWQPLKASNGLLLAQKSTAALPNPLTACSPTLSLPCPFFDFTRFTRTTNTPSILTPLIFGDGSLNLIGYDLQDDRDDGITFRFYWQNSAALPDNLKLWVLVYDDFGQLINDPANVPLPATLWYPPSSWQAGETIITETLPQLLPANFHLGLAVGIDETSLTNPNNRWTINMKEGQKDFILNPGKWLQLGSFQRKGHFLRQLPATPTFQPLTKTGVQFGSNIRLTGFWLDKKAKPGDSLPILLEWTAKKQPPIDFTIFIHLTNIEGNLVAQNDASPIWLTPAPTSKWLPSQPQLDYHTLALPDNISPGLYNLQLGLYNLQTLERLPTTDGNSMLLGQIEIE